MFEKYRKNLWGVEVTEPEYGFVWINNFVSFHVFVPIVLVLSNWQIKRWLLKNILLGGAIKL